MVKDVLQKISLVILVLLILFLNIGTIFTAIEYINYLTFSFFLIGFGIVAIFLYLINVIINKKVSLNFIIMTILTILSLISYYFAYNRECALYGALGRNEGIFVILTYYSIFLLASLNTKGRKYIIFTVILTGLFQIFVGFFQVLRLDNILWIDRSNLYSTTYKFASGTLGNPNFYSTYILICLTIVYTLFIDNATGIEKIIYGSLIFIFTFGLLIGNTTSCILAFIIILMATLFRKINKKNIKQVLIILFFLLLTLSLSLSFFDKFINHRIKTTFNKNMTEIVEIFDKGITDKTGNSRVYLWKNTLIKLPQYLLTGIGIDNFIYINDGTWFCEVDGEKCFDKAHNEYLQKLVTEGIFSFTIYLGYILYVVTSNIRKYKKLKNINKAILLAVLAYLIQAFFNISVISVAPLFYIMLGFLSSNINNERCGDAAI